jgi:hypothetical protein
MVLDISQAWAAAVMLPVSTTFTYTVIAWNRSIIKLSFEVNSLYRRLSGPGC